MPWIMYVAMVSVPVSMTVRVLALSVSFDGRNDIEMNPIASA